jgi:ribosomal protein S18 acetylase RimI-like enzyme
MDSTDLRLRPFVPGDDAEVTRWFADAGALRLFAGKRLRWPLDTAQWDGIRSDPTLTAWTAILGEDARPVGHGEIVEESPTEVRLAMIAVAPSVRGRGVGRTMVAALIEKCREADYSLVILFVHPDNATAIRAYRGLGFRPSPVAGNSNSNSLRMDLRLKK